MISLIWVKAIKEQVVNHSLQERKIILGLLCLTLLNMLKSRRLLGNCISVKRRICLFKLQSNQIRLIKNHLLPNNNKYLIQIGQLLNLLQTCQRINSLPHVLKFLEMREKITQFRMKIISWLKSSRNGKQNTSKKFKNYKRSMNN